MRARSEENRIAMRMEKVKANHTATVLEMMTQAERVTTERMEKSTRKMAAKKSMDEEEEKGAKRRDKPRPWKQSLTM